MAAKKNPNSKDLGRVLKSVQSGDLTAADKRILSDLLGHAIKMRRLVEKSKVSKSGLKVIARLPFGFDIVK